MFLGLHLTYKLFLKCSYNTVHPPLGNLKEIKQTISRQLSVPLFNTFFFPIITF